MPPAAPLRTAPRSGDGGHGEIVESGAGKFVKNNKYRPGGNQPKKIWLPASERPFRPARPARP